MKPLSGSRMATGSSPISTCSGSDAPCSRPTASPATIPPSKPRLSRRSRPALGPFEARASWRPAKRIRIAHPALELDGGGGAGELTYPRGSHWRPAPTARVLDRGFRVGRLRHRSLRPNSTWLSPDREWALKPEIEIRWIAGRRAASGGHHFVAVWRAQSVTSGPRQIRVTVTYTGQAIATPTFARASGARRARRLPYAASERSPVAPRMVPASAPTSARDAHDRMKGSTTAFGRVVA